MTNAEDGGSLLLASGEGRSVGGDNSLMGFPASMAPLLTQDAGFHFDMCQPILEVSQSDGLEPASWAASWLLVGFFRAATMFKVTALTKAVVYEIAKNDIAPILKERPAIAAELSQILARREAVGKAHLEVLAGRNKHGETLAERLAERMKDLFSLGA